jgi:hypothetical protein
MGIIKADDVTFEYIRRDEEGNVTDDSVTPKEYGRFLKTIFRQWVRNDLGRVNIQLFAETALILSGKKSTVCWLSETCGNILIVEKDGIEMSAVWFNVNAAKLPFQPYDRIDLLFQLNVNEFQNVTTLQMLVQDIRLSPDFEESLECEKACYEELRRGAEFLEEQNYLPTREDMACVYTLLRHEFRNGNTVFPIRRILSLLQDHGVDSIGYVKLKFIIRIMQELQICGVMEPGEDRYVFDFYFHTSKTNIEKSSILRRLKSQMRKTEA